ncbi:hypothetical protein [Rhizobium sp. BK379]|uniref:hypothetical protein n=1 Tax=Rhizobium sp. BK379 TaxID=2587059 RepID=UPI001622D32C|nr:hypothetical protein [Rhizobium sp. BK379]MBB3440970.1 hypothetical protein [Rhizobium sp. BK379]
MVSEHSGTGGKVPEQAGCRPHAIGMIQPLAGLFLAAGFVVLLAGRHERQLIHAERIKQEVVVR